MGIDPERRKRDDKRAYLRRDVCRSYSLHFFMHNLIRPSIKPMNNNFVVIFVTFGSKREAESAAGSLLKKRLVACASIIGKVGSKFWWNGRIDSASETLAIFKTSRYNFRAVEKEVKRLHSYEVPEIIAVPIVALSKDYRRWLKDSVV